MMNEADFRDRADEALDELCEALNVAGEDHGFEADMNAGALSVEFDKGGKFVVSPNLPVRQLWVSANVKSYKLDWDEPSEVFRLAATGQTLKEMMAEAISTHLKKTVEL